MVERESQGINVRFRQSGQYEEVRPGMFAFQGPARKVSRRVVLEAMGELIVRKGRERNLEVEDR